MQYEVKESGYGVTITSAKFDVIITPEAPLNVAIGESAKMEIPQAINYIKSGEAEIKVATDIGVSRISSTVTDGLNQYNANATATTTAYNDNATDKLGAYNLNAQNLTAAFDNNASDKTTDFNNNAVVKQAAVDESAAEAKQWAIGAPSEPTGNSAKYWANQAAGSLSGLKSRVTTIESEIPAQASSSNQLADKNFVNSSIATNTATFIGTFNSVAELEAYTGAKDDNDYAFVISTDAAGNTVYNRYKWNGTAWLFEYALNNSSFTANQWAAINSGATTTNIGQIATKADDNAVVHLSGSETITGTKTFNSEIYSTTDNTLNRTTTQGDASVRMFDYNSAVYTRLRSINNNASTPKETYLDVIAHQDGTTQIDIYADNVYAHTPNTYDITQQVATTQFVKNVLDTLYPVGAIYIGTQATCPLATLLPNTTWELVSTGRVLQGADSGHAAGTTIEAGLPNITGNTSLFINEATTSSGTGALTTSPSQYITGNAGGTNRGWQSITIDASRSSSIYGNSNTVQPPAYCVNIWRRTA